jgi:hypothetical protein
VGVDLGIACAALAVLASTVAVPAIAVAVSPATAVTIALKSEPSQNSAY